ncbi:MAG: stage V sporulation protein AE [Clostridiales bacterium]|jgi:stage V sporulation protein AE|nr:stage V sporulation protein AE [Clostridiales bacterium]
MEYLYAFLIGGAICAIAQLLIDKTKMMPGRILVLFVVIGVILGGIGVYEQIENFAGAGASVPIVGFGNALAKGSIKETKEKGLIGAFTGGIKQTAAGISSSIFFGFIASVIFKPKEKK